MRIKITVFALCIILLMLIPGILPKTGTVVDADTGKPIDGAVVLVEWTVTKGIGLTYHESYKVVEVVTDNEGKFKVSGVFNPFVDSPNLIIYKRGYVAWNNKSIFPQNETRPDFYWRSGQVFKLEKFLGTYSYTKHQFFIGLATMKLGPIFRKAYDEGERDQMLEEHRKLSGGSSRGVLKKAKHGGIYESRISSTHQTQ